jgi:hypothetical protein
MPLKTSPLCLKNVADNAGFLVTSFGHQMYLSASYVDFIAFGAPVGLSGTGVMNRRLETGAAVIGRESGYLVPNLFLKYDSTDAASSVDRTRL